jgi:V/A-type H+-transporting ATPase subunit E
VILLGEKEIMERIKDEAQAERDRIVNEAKEQADAMLKEVNEEIERRKKDFIGSEERKGVGEKERIIRSARLNARKFRWNTEEAMTERAFTEAVKRIKNVKEEGFTGNSYSDILAGLIKEASISIIAGGSVSNELEALISEEDTSYIDDSTLNKIATEISQDSKVDVSLSLSDERINSVGGVIVRGKDGKIVVNNTFEERIARFSSILREDIVKSLFTVK